MTVWKEQPQFSIASVADLISNTEIIRKTVINRETINNLINLENLKSNVIYRVM